LLDRENYYKQEFSGVASIHRIIIIEFGTTIRTEFFAVSTGGAIALAEYWGFTESEFNSKVYTVPVMAFVASSKEKQVLDRISSGLVESGGVRTTAEIRSNC